MGPGPVFTGAENLSSPGFDPRTTQPVASRSADYANPAHNSDTYCLRNNAKMNMTLNSKKPSNYITVFYVQAGYRCVTGI